MSRAPKFLGGDRKVQPDGSIRIDAMSWGLVRNTVIAAAMFASATCFIAWVVARHPVWLVLGSGLAFIPMAANRRRVFFFDAAKGVLQISDSSGETIRAITFEEIRSLDLASPNPQSRPQLMINDEALCWLGNSYANRDLKAELTKLVKPASAV